MSMWKMFQVQMPLYDVDDNLDVKLEDDDKKDDKSDDDKSDLDVLNDDDKDDKEDKDDKDDDKDEDDDSEADEDDDDAEGEDEDEADEDKEEKQALTRFNWTDVKKKFPGIEKVEGLKAAFFNGQQLEQRFPTIKEADAAIKDQENYRELKDLLLEGDTKTLLTNIKQVSDESLKEFSTSFLASLHTVDKGLYADVVDPVIKNVLYNVKREGDRTNNTNLKNAAILINRMLYESDDVKPDTRTGKVKDEKLENERNQFYETKRLELVRVVANDCERRLLAEIEKGLDPTEVMKDKPNLKKRVIKTIVDEIRDQLEDDQAHIGYMQSLWSREKRAGYSGQLKGSFVTAYLSRAKAILPKIRHQVRADMLGITKKSDTSRRKQDERLEPGNDTGNKGQSKVISVKDARAKGLSERDILAGRGA